MTETRRAIWRALVDAAELAVLSAVVSGALAAAIMAALFCVLMGAVSDGLYLLPLTVLPRVAAAMGLLIGAVVAAFRRPISPRPWALAAAVTLALTLGLAVAAVPLGLMMSGIVQLVAVGVVAVPLPAAIATSLSTLLAYRTPKAVKASRAALVAVAALAIGLGVLHLRAAQTRGAQEIKDIAVTRAGKIYLATGSGLYRAHATKLEWLRLDCGERADYVSAVAAAVDRPRWVLARVRETWWESSDGGDRWHEATEIQGAALDVINATKHGVYALDRFCGLWVNRDSKFLRWEKRIFRPGAQGLPSAGIMAVSPDRPGFVVVGSGWMDRLLLTRDDGNTWQEVPLPSASEEGLHGGVQDLAMVPGVSEIILVATEDSLFSSQDDGRTWEQIQAPEDDLLYAALAVAPTRPPTIYLEAGLKLYASHDLGSTWRDTRLTTIGDDRGVVACMAVDPANARTLYVGLTGGVYRSRDSGQTWERIR